MKILKSSKIYRFRLSVINFVIITSLSLVIIKNLQEIRFSLVTNENGETFVLDRFTSKIKVKKDNKKIKHCCWKGFEQKKININANIYGKILKF